MELKELYQLADYKYDNGMCFNADCLECMKDISDKSIDMILCDLPYNITSMSWDCLISFEDLWNLYNRIVKYNGVICLFSVGLFTIDLINSNRKNFLYKLIWNKNVPTGMSSAKYRPMKYYEEICIFKNKNKNIIYNPIMKERVGKHKECYNNYEHYCGKNNHININKIKKTYDPNLVQPSDILDFKVVPNRSGKLHPTQKPVDLLEYLIKTYTNKGMIVLDNCMGSGSTAIACKNLDRYFIGIEKDKKYFDIAVERINNDIKRTL
jgi:site-specific DNA-methyltransferase (adenine-specific)